MLRGGARDAPPRPQTLHAVVESLLQVADTPTGTRFRMLETVREFSAAHRQAAGESEQVVGGFMAWAREFGVAQHESPFGPDPFSSVARIRAEQDNPAQALRYGLAHADGGTVAATSAVLGGLWTIESNYSPLAALAEETAGVLSHFRPGPELVEVTRTALTLPTPLPATSGRTRATWTATWTAP